MNVEISERYYLSILDISEWQTRLLSTIASVISLIMYALRTILDFPYIAPSRAHWPSSYDSYTLDRNK